MFSINFGDQDIITTDAVEPTSVFAANMDGDDDIDVISASAGDNRIVWYENDGSGNFIDEHVISTDAPRAASVFAADLDGDLDMDVLSASGNKIVWYENLGDGRFRTALPISTDTAGAMSVFAAHVNKDNKLDVISASTNQIVWYENLGEGNFSEAKDVNDASNGPNGAVSVFAADVNKDTYMDVISVSGNKIVWYKNEDGEGNFFDYPIIISDDADGATSVFADDVNDDAYIDVISFSGDKIAWYENDPSQNFTAHTITSGADGVTSVFAADLDGDGDRDVLSASGNNITWYTNDGDGNFSTNDPISTDADGATSVFAADLDGDDDIDVLSASFITDVENKIAWYENPTNSNFDNATDLGPVDFLVQSAEDLLYRVETTQAGYLTVQVDGGSSAILEVYDADGNLLPYSINEQRVDVTAGGAGEVYFIKLSGTNTNVRLRVCNLVEQTGTTVTVSGTSDNDHYQLQPDMDYLVTVNGIAYQFTAADMTNVNFNGADGDDTYELALVGVSMAVNDSAGTDTLDFIGAAQGIEVDLSNAAGQVQQIASGNTLTITGTIENCIGSAYDDIITGNGADNRLEGRGGDDKLRGKGGDDTLLGENGIDILRGGNDDDLLRGGEGDDVLCGHRGNDILLGGGEADTLRGGRDRDILIGGTERDRLRGQSSDDILIGGTTAHDANDAALLAILAEWKRSAPIDDRIDHLQNGGGLNDPYYLNPGVDVLDDAALDTLYGGKDGDWFLSDPGDDHADKGSADR